MSMLNEFFEGVKRWALDTPERARTATRRAVSDTKHAVAEPVRDCKRAYGHAKAVVVGREVFSAESGEFEYDGSLLGRVFSALKCVGNLAFVPFDLAMMPVKIATAWLRAGLHIVTGFNHDVCDGIAHAVTGVATFVAAPHAVAAAVGQAAAFGAGSMFAAAPAWKVAVSAVATAGIKTYGFLGRVSSAAQAIGGLIEAAVITTAMAWDHFFGDVTGEMREEFGGFDSGFEGYAAAGQPSA